MHDVSESEPAAHPPADSSISHLAALFDQPAAGFAEAGLDGRILRANDRYCQLVGLPREQLIGQAIADLTHPEHREDTSRRFRRLVENGEPFTVEKRYLRPDGTVSWAQVYGSAVRSAEGRIIGAVAVAIDITDRKLTEQALRESEARFREVADAAPVLIWLADTNNKGIWYNNAWLDFTGRTMEQELGDGWLANVHPDDVAHCAEVCGGAFARREPFRLDFRMRRADGEWRVIDDSAVPRFAEDGTFVGYIGSCIDVTDARSSEQALRESEARFRALVTATSDVVYRMSADWMEMIQLDGRGFIADTDQPRVRWIDEYIFPEDHDFVMAAIDQAIRTRSTFQLEHRVRRVDGSTGWTFSRAIPLLDDEGEIEEWFGVASDITARKEADQALLETTQRLNAIINNTRMAVFMMDARQHCVFMNKAAEELTGFTFEETLGRPLHDVIHHKYPDGRDYPLHECPIDRAFPEDDQVQGEEIFVHKDGHFYPVAFTASPMRNEAGETIGTVIEAKDITEEKRAQQAAEEQSRILETLNRTGAAVAGELDLQKLVQMVTDAGVELTNAQFGAFFYNVINDAGESYMLYTLSGADPSQFNFGMPRNTDVFHPTFSGEGPVRSDDITRDPRYGNNPPHNGMPRGHLPVHSYLAVPVISRSGEVIGGLFFGHHEVGRFTGSHERLMTGLASQAAVSIDNARLYQALQRANETLEQRVQDRTAELATANEALRQAQKMEAIGQLTGGIAHDFNNMLTVIRGSADVLQRGSSDEAKRQRYIQAIAETADRAARLTSQLLAFARRQALKPEVFDVNLRVDAIAEMLQTVLGSRIRLIIESTCEDCFVEADSAQFETALVNMAVNARDAMHGEGELRIEVARTDSLPGSDGLPAEHGYVTVQVSDTGEGIADADLDRIFEPFFTTKETGKGTGLGLSQVYGFAKQSGGEIEVTSKPGRGSSFTLYLPGSTSSETAENAVPPASAEPRVEGRVLVVEDNDHVGRFAEQVLGEIGFDTRRAASAAQALELLESGERFDVVFSDIVMPGQNGIELASEIRKRWPGLPIVLTTGYSDALALKADHPFPILHKPYSLEALSRAIGQAVTR